MSAKDPVFSVEDGLRYRFPTHVNDLPPPRDMGRQ